MHLRIAPQRLAMRSQSAAQTTALALQQMQRRADWQPRLQLATEWRLQLPLRRIAAYTAVAGLVGIGAVLVRRLWLGRRGFSTGEWAPASLRGAPSASAKGSGEEKAAKGEGKQPEAKGEEKDACQSCESCPLLGTLKGYQKQVLICTGKSSWPRDIEEESGSFAEAFGKALASLNTSKMKVKVTAIDEPSAVEGKVTVFVYPENVCYDLTFEDIPKFVETQVLRGERCEELQPREVPFKKLVLVCTHAERDKRCGRAGPQVIQALTEEATKRNISPEELAVRSSSHVGGHRFAGVVTVLPTGDNYGYITAKNASKLLDHILAGEILKECWRGKPSPDW